MTKLNMHAISAPVFVALMNNLATWLDKAKAHAAEKKFDVSNLLNARLAPDMIALDGQIRLATAWAKNCQCRLAGQTPPDFPDTDVTFEQLKARISRAVDIVQSITERDLEGADSRTINYNLGPEIKMSQSGLDYFNTVALPNFYFHVTMAYAILRHNGLNLGKTDFMVGLVQLPGR